MKALSIRQPWAWAILHAGKRIENRDWAGCSFRGPILIHAGKSVGTRAEFEDAVDDILDVAKPAPGAERIAFVKPLAKMVIGGRGYHHAEGHWVPADDLPLGGIVGRAVIDGVLRTEADFAAYGANVDEAEGQRVWWTGGFALVLRDVESLPFVPYKGALGFFDVPGALLRGAA